MHMFEDRTHSVSVTRSLSLSFSVCLYVSGYSGLIFYCLVSFLKTHSLSLSCYICFMIGLIAVLSLHYFDRGATRCAIQNV